MALLLFLAVMIIASTQSDDIDRSFEVTVKFGLRVVILYFAFCYFLKKNYISPKLILIFAIISLGIQSLDGIYQYITGVDLFKQRELYGYRLTGATFNPNIFGFFMAIFTLLLTHIMINLRNLSVMYKVFTITFIVIALFCLFLSGSRSALLGCLVAILYLLLTVPNSRKHLLRFFVPLTLILLFTIYLASPDMFYDRVNKTIETISDGNSLRLRIWLHTFSLFLDTPLLGQGPDAYNIIPGAPLPETNVHNIYLEIALCMGITGLLAFSYLLFKIFKQLSSIKKFESYAHLYSALFFLLLVAGFFDHSFLDSKIYQAVFVILMSLVSQQAQRKQT
ncbi:MAG: hypothetical protein GTN99_08960 [Candidatus Dadabacteria bacterium]|nr:hypothetical protein [Candidatus Dadabacteria bacterium]